ncbi:MAG TPA: DUF5668 domain-containing protein [Candidatus Xenobia bacterium]|nr:DUF5668 domain-containing protein [Candidatus Xenobia bacterium]
MSESPTSTPAASLPAVQSQARGYCCCMRCRLRGITWPVMMITVGALFLADQFTSRFDWGDWWPVLLIVLGLMKLIEHTASTAGHRG